MRTCPGFYRIGTTSAETCRTANSRILRFLKISLRRAIIHSTEATRSANGNTWRWSQLMRKPFLVACLQLSLFCLLAGCKMSGFYPVLNSVPVTSLSMNSSTMTLSVGGPSGSLQAAILPATASNQNLTWTSSNSSVAVVSGGGQVTGLTPGTATITASATDGSNKSASCAVTVTAHVAVTGVGLNCTYTPLIVGSYSGYLYPIFLPSNASNQNVTWTSSKPAVATVTGYVSGTFTYAMVSPVSAGTAIITVTTVEGGFTASCEVVVTSPVLVSSVSIPATLSLSLSSTTPYAYLAYTVTPSNATNQTLMWSTSNSSIAIVSAYAQVTGLTQGTATITATSTDGSNKSASCVVTVGP